MKILLPAISNYALNLLLRCIWCWLITTSVKYAIFTATLAFILHLKNKKMFGLIYNTTTHCQQLEKLVKLVLSISLKSTKTCSFINRLKTSHYFKGFFDLLLDQKDTLDIIKHIFTLVNLLQQSDFWTNREHSLLVKQ